MGKMNVPSHIESVHGEAIKYEVTILSTHVA